MTPAKCQQHRSTGSKRGTQFVADSLNAPGECGSFDLRKTAAAIIEKDCLGLGQPSRGEDQVKSVISVETSGASIRSRLLRKGRQDE